MNRAVGVLLLLAFCGAAQAQDAPDSVWRPVFTHEQGPVSIDLGSIRREGEWISVRSRVVWNVETDERVKRVDMRFLYNCARRSSIMMNFAEYDTAGRSLRNADLSGDKAEPTPIENNTPNATILDIICG